MSLRRAQVARPSTQRRLSLDLRTLSPESFKAGPARLKKSRSALTSMRRVAKPDLVDELVDSYFNEDSEQREPVDEKQHALNVRRAKKMMQLFGDKPPKELFQIHSHRNRDISTDTISILTTVSENRRESRATFTSVTSSLSITRRVRNSVHSSNSEPSSPVVFSGPEGSGSAEVRNDAQKEGAKESMESEPKSKGKSKSFNNRSARSRPASPRPLGPRPRPSLASLKLSYSPHTHTSTLNPRRRLSPPSLSRRCPQARSQSPRPRLSPTWCPSSQVRPTRPSSNDRPPPARCPRGLRARRIRAAKLSRFFGVPPHDLTEAFANPPTSPTFPSAPQWVNAARRPRTPRQDARESSSTSSLPLHTQSEERPRSPERPSFTVEVAADLPRPFRLGRTKGMRKSWIWMLSWTNSVG
ncbi:hypothetical protein C8Q72DRAFT_887580 [Fomitopsis betulina]|nr:hypothetical protein C8Q72DRAFT_887580 [Fomitopsis betulina]